MVQRSQLSNGLRVVSAEMPGVPSATLGLWVENGSRYENEQQSGISHFLEHLFKNAVAIRAVAHQHNAALRSLIAYAVILPAIVAFLKEGFSIRKKAFPYGRQNKPQPRP